MKPAMPKTQQSPLTQLRKVVIGGSLMIAGLLVATASVMASEPQILGGGSEGWDKWHMEGNAWQATTMPRTANPCGQLPHMESGETSMGSLRSPVFAIKGDTIRFWANGWKGDRRKGRNTFYLRLATDGSVVRQSDPPDSDDFSPTSWVVSDLKGKEVYFEAVDKNPSPMFGWIGLARVEEGSFLKSSDSTAFYALKFDGGLGAWGIMHSDGGGRAVAGYLSSLANGESAVGSIETPDFTIANPEIRLVLRGWDGLDGKKQANRVELVDADTGKVLRTAAPPLSDDSATVTLNVADLIGKKVFLAFIDGNSNGGYAWFGVDEIDAGKEFHIRFADNPSLSDWQSDAPKPTYVEKGGVPFLAKPASVVPDNGKCSISPGVKAKQLFLLGMTGSLDQGCACWDDPRNIQNRFWVGDQLGTLWIKYADGVTNTYPLVLGDNLWWASLFANNPEPFASNPQAAQILNDCLNLYGQKPSDDGRYVAVISPRDAVIDSIEIEDASSKPGVPVITGLTLQAATAGSVSAGIPLPSSAIAADMSAFIAQHALQPQESAGREAADRMKKLADVLYVNQSQIDAHQSTNPIPAGYTGPRVSFKGDVYADILTAMFHHNVKDICDKVDPDGFYNTSTKGAPTWGGYNGFGTFKTNYSAYYKQCWNRDMGRSAMELCRLGYLDKCLPIANCVFNYARAWEDTNQPGVTLAEYNPLLNGSKLPRHVPRRMNYINTKPGEGCFDNDSHGLTSLFVYNLWKHLPNRDAWLRSNWEDVKGLADWIVWQFENPALSGATDVLRTDSESAGGTANSIYPDFICLEAVRGLAEMADSIGKNAEAVKWRETAARFQKGIERNYAVNDPKYGKVWTLDHAGWPNRSTIFGPLIILADRRGLTPEDDDAGWRSVTEASYQRLLDTYTVPKAFGYFGVAMGYGQGFITESALLLDKMGDAGKMLEWAARLTYDPRYESYIVPEGCELEPNGQFWHRTGDLGNGVQEAEIVKALRIVIGVDDNNPATLRIFPRMPDGWNEISIEDYPALVNTGGQWEQVSLAYKLIRSANGMSIQVKSSRPLPAVNLRLGPLKSESKTAKILVGKNSSDAKYEKSGDSWWVRVSISKGRKEFVVEVKR